MHCEYTLRNAPLANVFENAAFPLHDSPLYSVYVAFHEIEGDGGPSLMIALVVPNPMNGYPHVPPLNVGRKRQPFEHRWSSHSIALVVKPVQDTIPYSMSVVGIVTAVQLPVYTK